MQKKWKYAKEKAQMDFDEYLILPLDKKFKITMKNWVFAESYYDGENKKIFRTDVIKINGKDADKSLVIKSYENVQELKKKLAKKTSARHTSDVEITRKYSDDEMDYYFEIEFLKYKPF